MKKIFSFGKNQPANCSVIPASLPPPPPPLPPPPPPTPPSSNERVTFDASSSTRYNASSRSSVKMEAFDEALLRIPEDPVNHVVEAHPQSRHPTKIFKRIRGRLRLEQIVDDEKLLIREAGGGGGGGGERAASSDVIPSDVLRFVCLSDTHNKAHWLLEPDWTTSFGVPSDIFSPTPLPKGDVLLHCGDFTNYGKRSEVEKFNEFLGRCPFPVKIVVAGNHELTFDPDCRCSLADSSSSSSSSSHPSSLITNATYVQDGGVSIGGVRIWASPWQPVLGHMAFNLPRGESLLEKWNAIPGCVGETVEGEVEKGDGSPDRGATRTGEGSSSGASRRDDEKTIETERSTTEDVAVNGFDEPLLVDEIFDKESADGEIISGTIALSGNASTGGSTSGTPNGSVTTSIDASSDTSASTHAATSIHPTVDILMTHGPPLGIGDTLHGGNKVVGCAELLASVRQRVRPKFHVFGHIHEHNGCWTDGTTTFINASICNGMYYPVQKVWKFDVRLPPGVDKEEALGNWSRFGG